MRDERREARAELYASVLSMAAMMPVPRGQHLLLPRVLNSVEGRLKMNRSKCTLGRKRLSRPQHIRGGMIYSSSHG